jgi:hypothetical protein
LIAARTLRITSGTAITRITKTMRIGILQAITSPAITRQPGTPTTHRPSIAARATALQVPGRQGIARAGIMPAATLGGVTALEAAGAVIIRRAVMPLVITRLTTIPDQSS